MSAKPDFQDDQRPSIDDSKKCYICGKGFNFRKKHICRFCMNAVCADHCQKARSKQQYEEPQPICDLCNKEQIEGEIKSEILAEVQALEEELQYAKSMNSKLEREHFEKTAVISKLENEVDDTVSAFTQEINSLKDQLEAEESEYVQTKSAHKSAKSANKTIKDEYSANNENLEKAQQDLENLRRQAEILKETKDQLESQLDKITSKLKGSLNTEQVSKILCQACSLKLENASKHRETPSILEDSSVVSESPISERESIIQSIREYKDALDHQASHPTEPAKCCVF